jgi:hypothetical protein
VQLERTLQLTVYAEQLGSSAFTLQLGTKLSCGLDSFPIQQLRECLKGAAFASVLDAANVRPTSEINKP